MLSLQNGIEYSLEVLVLNSCPLCHAGLGRIIYVDEKYLSIFYQLFFRRFGKVVVRHPTSMSQISSGTTTSTPPNVPMSQETFEYLWQTLGDVTENG